MIAPLHALNARSALALLLLGAAVACTNTSNNAPGPVLGNAGATGGLAMGGAGGGGGDTSPDASSDGPPDASAPYTGYLWFAGSALNAFTKSQTEASNDTGPKFVFVPDFPITNLHDVVFDAGGNAWVIPISGNQLLRFPASSLVSGAPPMPDLVLAGPSLSSPASLVFDSSGNLWVLNYDGAGSSVANIVRFDNLQGLSGSVGPTAALTLGPGTVAANKLLFSQASSLVFDAANNLWLVSVSHVVRIDNPLALQGSAIVTPTTVLSTTGDAYAAAAFDAAGSLWITGAHAGYFVLRIDNPGALTGTVTATPAARAQLPSDQASFAAGMAFDADGALWVALSNRLVKLPDVATLSGTMNVTPTVILGLTGLPDLTSKLVIRPQPAGLPIY
jgi:sugar lactone lactonase YvrE